MSTLERGFKSWSERVALGIRRDLKLQESDPLPPSALAAHLGVELLTPDDIPGLPAGVRAQLLDHDPWGWSAVTQTVGSHTRVIYNPMHSAGRRASNITHELAHVLLDHQPGTIILSPDGVVAMRTFDARQEDEAGWLSGCLLLPRVAIVDAFRRGRSPEQTAAEFGVTEVLVNYRSKITGVVAQRSRAIRAPRVH